MAAAIVEGLLGVAAEGSERFMRSKQPNGVHATGTTARHLGILSEVNLSFSSPLNHYNVFNCAWTHCAAEVSDTYDWTPHQRGHGRDLDQAAVVAPGDGSETGDTTPCPLDDDAAWQPCRLDDEGVPRGRAGYATGDVIIISMSGYNGEKFWLEGVVVAVTFRKKQYSALKDILVVHRTSDLKRYAESINSDPQWQHVMKVDLSQSVRQIWLWGGAAVQHPTLFNAMLGHKCEAPKEIEMIMGPPGTGKTRGISERMLGKLSEGAPFVGLRTAWTNQAVRNCVHDFIDLSKEKGLHSTVLLSRLVYVSSSEADTRKFKDIGVQTVTLTMKDLPVWESLLARAKSEPLVFHITVGKSAGEERFWRTCLDVLACLVDLLHIDEGGQILHFNGKHLLRFLKPDSGQLVLTGDTAQLPAYALSRWHTYTLMRYLGVSVVPLLLRVQYRQICGLSALPSCMFYAGLVRNADIVKQPSQATLLLVTWKRDPSAAVGFPAHFEASLAAQLFRKLAFVPESDAILTFYKDQRDLIVRELPFGSPCKIIDSSQGFVVEGLAGRAKKLSSCFYHSLTLQEYTQNTF